MPCLQGCSFLSLLLLLQIVLTAAAGRAGCAADSLLSLLAAEQGQIFLSHFAVSTPRECISCVDACAFWGGGREEWHSRAEFGKSICAGGKKKEFDEEHVVVPIYLLYTDESKTVEGFKCS